MESEKVKEKKLKRAAALRDNLMKRKAQKKAKIKELSQQDNHKEDKNA